MPRAGVLELTPYPHGESSVPGVARVIRLASNENALAPSPRALEAFCAAAREVNRYPEPSAAILREMLAARFGLDASRIVCGSGSGELIELLARAYAGAGDEVLCSEFGYLLYQTAARRAGATPVMAPEPDLVAVVDALTRAVTERTRVVFLANPNNPTGSYLSNREVDRLHATLPSNVLLVLDAAYAEYVDGDDYEVGDALVDAADNVVMLRTFSKIYGLAGARIGWGYCSRSVADVLHRVRPLDSVTASAAAAAVAALDDVEHIELCRAENARWRTWFVDQASKMGGVTPYPSHGNFVLMRFSDEPGRGAAAVYEALRRRGVIARPMTPYGLADCLRFTIGTGEEMQLAAETLHAVLAAAT